MGSIVLVVRLVLADVRRHYLPDATDDEIRDRVLRNQFVPKVVVAKRFINRCAQFDTLVHLLSVRSGVLSCCHFLLLSSEQPQMWRATPGFMQ